LCLRDHRLVWHVIRVGHGRLILLELLVNTHTQRERERERVHKNEIG
jgi:hypothetical protein